MRIPIITPLIALTINLCCYLISVWFVLSIALSVYKVASGTCGTKVGIEKLLVKGELFCPTK